MARARKASRLAGDDSPPLSGTPAPGAMTRTTLYIGRDLRQAAKRGALDTGLSLNAFIIAAIEDRVAAVRTTFGSPEAARGRTASHPSATLAQEGDLHALVRQLTARLSTVEGMLAQDRRTSEPPSPHQPLSVQEVRRAVREILLAHGAPIPHRPLLDILMHERGLALPGRDVSENLRTILVHPRARGFLFTRARGYWLDDRPIPPKDPTSLP